jgi:hypothetical protein
VPGQPPDAAGRLLAVQALGRSETELAQIAAWLGPGHPAAPLLEDAALRVAAACWRLLREDQDQDQEAAQ